MRVTIPTLLTGLLLATLPAAHAQSPAAAAKTTPADAAADSGALRDAEALGQRLFRLDRAAWVASDTLVAAARGRIDPRVQGWITEEREDGVDVIYVDATPAALYRVGVDAQGQPAGLESRPAPLTPAQLGAAQARAAALAAAPPSCTGFYNAVTLPGPSPERWTVYLLPGVADERQLPVGGAWRFDMQGQQVIAQRGYTHSCLMLDNRPDGAAFTLNHPLDPTPTGIHVFWALWAGKPMIVTTTRGSWGIATDGAIVPVATTGTPAGGEAPATMTPQP